MKTFSAKTFQFLDELSDGRDKPWFDANRGAYEEHLLDPLRDFVETVGPALREEIPELEIRPNVNKTITRINRDMRFSKGQSPYKDNMLALFYREGRKREDAQLFLGLQPSGTWMGLYVPTPLLGSDSPIVSALDADPDAVIATARKAGVGEVFDLVSCKKYGEVEKHLDPVKPESFPQTPHLCALRTHEPGDVAKDPHAFVDHARDMLVRLVPLWRIYSGAKS